MINGDFKRALELVLESNSEQNERIEEHLQKQKNDFIGALKTIPFRMLKLYVHSYQSFLFNRALEENISVNAVGNKVYYDEKIPIVGFSTELRELKNNKTKKIIEKLMEEEKIRERNFIIRAIPDLSSEGSERNAFINISDFKIIRAGKDELNESKEKVVVSFYLPKGCYATVLMDFLFNA